MKNILNTLIKSLPLLYLIYLGFKSYNKYQEITEIRNEELSTLDSIEKQIKAEKRKIKKAEEFNKNLEESKARVKDVANQIELAQKQLPNTIDDTLILGIFKEEAAILNIKSININPLVEQKKDFYFSKQYELKAQGTFLQFLIFFERMVKSDRLINVNSLTIEKSIEKNKGRFQLLTIKSMMEAFRYNPDYKSIKDEDGDGQDE